MNIENKSTNAQRCSRVLHLICIKRKDAYTSEILDTLKNAKLLVVEGTIYPLLTRLKKRIVATVGKNPHQDHPKYYGLTEIGQTFLNELNSTWTELSDAVNLITNQNNSHEQDCKYKLRRNVLSYRRRCIPEINALF
jgi:PadR family transcriptional regulator PadR